MYFFCRILDFPTKARREFSLSAEKNKKKYIQSKAFDLFNFDLCIFHPININ